MPTGMRRRRVTVRATAVAALALVAVAHVPSQTAVRAASPTWLPNGRMLTPAGTTLTATDFPAGMVLGPGTSPLFVAGSGERTSDLGAIDRTTLRGAYRPLAPGGSPVNLTGSLAMSPDGSTVYAAGASGNAVYSFAATQSAVESTTYPLPDGRFAAGVATEPRGRYLLVTEPFDPAALPFQRGHTLTRITLSDSSATSVTVGDLPYRVATSTLPSGAIVAAVADLGSGAVSVVDVATMATVATVAVGRQPSDLVFTGDGRHLLVVSSLDDRLQDIDTSTWSVASTLSLSPSAGIGAGPDGIAVSADGARVFVPLTQDNAVAVVARSASGALTLAGRIPTAWWPTAVAYDDAAGALLVAGGKGENLGAATPSGVDADTVPANNFAPSGAVNPQGTVERIPLAGGAPQLAAWSAQVAVNNGWNAPATPAAVCGPAAINHVVFIVRENKTYDQVFGDMPAGGAPALTVYGRAITPNAHALADRFGLLTAFYDDEEVSDIGHPALAGGVTSNFMERTVLQNYGGYEPVEYANYGSDAKGAGYNDDSVQWGPSDYIINDALRSGVRYLDFGYTYRNSSSNVARAMTPAEEAATVRDFPGYGFDLSVKDQTRAAFWSARWKKDVAAGTVPPFEVVYLPDDHTGGSGTPAGEVADNDLATGQIVDTISHSSLWGSTAVFIEEDDPQSGADHIDQHRSIGLMVSAWNKPAVISAVHHDQTSMLRTIEALLGLPPLTEVDATATPLTELWAAAPDLTPYSAVAPTVPAMLPAAQAAAQSYARARLAPYPDALHVPSAVQRDVQWFYAHGTPFNAAAAAAAPGTDLPEQHLQVGATPAGFCARALARAPGQGGLGQTAGQPGLTDTTAAPAAAGVPPVIAAGALLLALGHRRRRATR